MDALFLIWAKFAAELVYLQVGIVFLLSSYFLYSWVLRRNGLRRTDMVPAAIVKEHLDKIATEERIMRQRLFGEGSVAPVLAAQHAPLAGEVNAAVASADPALLKELQAVRAQLGAADLRAAEFDKRIAGLQAEKAELEKKLSTASTAPAAAGATSAANPAMEKELTDLRAKLAEYEVIEDDLANLKKYQLENKALQEKIAQFDKSVASAPVAVATAPAPVAAAPAAPAPAPEPVALAPAPTPEPVAASTPAPSNVAPISGDVAAASGAAPAASAAAPAAPEKSTKDKEQELLSEFEKMLAS